ncbi:MAG: hypothetical protein CMF36_17960 [Leeuwenhoekiella sp.]|nr:hypothetical protein [Leeuwenhoekiella sp.]MBA83017.1 hypothetical protein [Leeuwenhoekiella sp.]
MVARFASEPIAFFWKNFRNVSICWVGLSAKVKKLDTPTLKMCAVFQHFKDTLFLKFRTYEKQKTPHFLERISFLILSD